VTNNLYDLTFTTNKGENVSLNQYAGKAILIVNTASKCGLTPQYEGLQSLHKKYESEGLVVIGFPCDQFAHQEPGNDTDIAEFCSINYGVDFTLSSKVDVNGSKAHPVYKFLKKKSGGLLGGLIKWNFTKFLVSPDGKTIKRYAPTVLPTAIESDISAYLARS
jgi:glutathione peroxidase